MIDKPSFTTEELIAECKRELKQRLHVYPRLVANHTLSQKLADQQIAKMEAILTILCDLDDAERLL